MKTTKQQPPLVPLNLNVWMPIRRARTYEKPMPRRHILLKISNMIPVHPPIIVLNSPEIKIPPCGIPLPSFNVIIIAQNAINKNPPPSMRTKNQSSPWINMRARNKRTWREERRIVVVTSPPLQKRLETSASCIVIRIAWKCV
jgi:hypothetical protein